MIRAPIRLGVAAALLAVAAASGAPTFAETLTKSSPRFSEFHGDWVGTGTVLGRPSTAKARFGPTLDGAALQFDFDLTMGTEPPQRFFGHGVYRVDSKARITGQWFDSSGAQHVMKGQWTAREWTVTWGSPLTEIGRSRYRLTDDGGLAVTDWTLQGDGSWRIFAEMNYRRAPD